MSNLALKILYNLFNSIEGVACERVFAPDRDFESELRKIVLPLFSLESSTPLNDFDLICFSIGYELTYTNILNILDLAGIPLLSRERSAGNPIIMAGGPAVANPLPIGSFVDCFYLGEAELGIEKLFSDLVRLKTRGAGREDLLDYLREQPFIWHAGQKNRVKRAVWQDFGMLPTFQSTPIPNIKVVQDNGTVEIMRGCPGGCRFCQAGICYRPYRMKDPEVVASEVRDLILKGGYREINLSSLSSGDYGCIKPLLRGLNDSYGGLNVSFSLPSLRIDSFTISLLSELNPVRKSGLTFAVETPRQAWQLGINKIVPLQKTKQLLQEAKKLGWNKAKFYFMIGLPVSESDETDPIINFLKEVQSATGMVLHANIASFIPKPHTPFQWSGQLSEEDSLAKIIKIKKELARKKVKIGYHSPFSSVLEGILCRGDAGVGPIIQSAFRKGARLDAWDEHLDRDIWRSVLKSSHSADLVTEILQARDTSRSLPWDCIDMGVSKAYLLREFERAMQSMDTPQCKPDCKNRCGICRKETHISECKKPIKGFPAIVLPGKINLKHVLLRIAKGGRARFYSHLNMLKILERSLLRAGYRLKFTEGYNPKPRIEFANPLSLGISSDDEVVLVDFLNADNCYDLIDRINRSLPDGFAVQKAELIDNNRKSKKKRSLMALYWGSDFLLTGIYPAILLNSINSHPTSPPQGGDDSATVDRSFDDICTFSIVESGILMRLKRTDKKGHSVLKILEALLGKPPLGSGLEVRRIATWAVGPDGEPISYFRLFK